jgi:dihydroflavonol-4-reductase
LIASAILDEEGRPATAPVKREGIMRKVFVTGGSGFIGKHLTATLLNRGVHCRVLVRRSSVTRHLRQPGVELVYGAIEQPETYAAALRDCDTVIHMAGLTSASNRGTLFRINAEACGILADACIAAAVPRVVYLSSLAAAGPPPAGKQVRDEADPAAPISDYGRSKLEGENEFRKRAAQLATTVLRPGVVYGADDEKIRQMVEPIANWRLHLVVGFRTPVLSLIHVDDLIQLILLAAAKGEALLPQGQDATAGIYFACDDAEFITYADFGRRIARAIDRRVLVWPLWRWVGMCVGWSAQNYQKFRGRASIVNVDKVREATASSWACSSQKARRGLGFAPENTLDNYLPEMVSSYIACKAANFADSADPAV